MSSPFSQAPGGPDQPGPIGGGYNEPIDPVAPRSPAKLRQDFIADARRAKSRLAAEAGSEGPDVVINRPDATVATGAATDGKAPIVPGAALGKSTSKSRTEAAKSGGSASGTPRLRVMALGGALALAVGGAWYVTQLQNGSSGAVATTTEPQASGQQAAEAGLESSNAKGTQPNAPAMAPATGDDAAGTKSKVPAVPAEDGAIQLNIQEGTRGEIVTDELTVGSVSVPLFGVAVDSAKPMSPSAVEKAKRQQAMAAVSTQLGEAALQNPAALAINAGLDPKDAVAPAGGQSSVAKGGMSQSSALDLPPATVGPLSLRLAAANGDPSAEFEVGARLAEGKGTSQNFKDAAKWYQRSASKGFGQAQYRLGTLYERGLGLKADPVRAEEWYKQAAEQGNVKAMHNLAVLSANQSGGSPDYATAAQWFEKAAEHGLSDSQFNLAVLHENGLGVEKDLTTAYKWLALAAKGGDKEAVRRRDILQGKLTGDELKKAEGMIGMWKAKIPNQQVNDPRKAGEAWKTNPSNGING